MSDRIVAAQVVLLLEEATQSEAGTLTSESDLQGLDGWDSMGMVMFMGLVNEETEIELSVADLRDCRNPQELLAAILRCGTAQGRA